MTITILIGNSDDKLRQAEWSWFCSQVHDYLRAHGYEIHFAGYSSGNQPWQNACFVAEVWADNIEQVKGYLSRLAEANQQDSIAFISGVTEFIKP